jgi:dTDP-4-amino-4,6-dideoxygalactose transaminase
VICTNAENLYKHSISIPLFPKMTDEEVHYVIKAVEDIVK